MITTILTLVCLYLCGKLAYLIYLQWKTDVAYKHMITGTLLPWVLESGENEEILLLARPSGDLILFSAISNRSYPDIFAEHVDVLFSKDSGETTNISTLEARHEKHYKSCKLYFLNLTSSIEIPRCFTSHTIECIYCRGTEIIERRNFNA